MIYDDNFQLCFISRHQTDLCDRNSAEKKNSILGTDSCQGILGTEKSQNFTVKTFSTAASENKRPWIESRKYRKIFQEVLSDRIIIFSHEK